MRTAEEFDCLLDFHSKLTYIWNHILFHLWTYSGLLLTQAMMGRTSFHGRVFTACLVTFTGIFMQCSWGCDTLAEPTDLKAYRSAIVVEGTLDGSTAFVERKTMKGQFPSRVSDIQLRGFASEDPCTGPISSFTQNTTYLLFINETNDEGVYKLMANPEESSRTGKRTVRKVVKDGGPPVLTKRLKPKSMGEGDRLLLTCAGKGTPMPLMYWERDGRRLQDNDIPRLKIKPSKRNVKLLIRNLDKNLHEGTYTCVLTNKVDPPIRASSSLSICAIKCMHGERHPKKCRCVCDEGYSGDLCQIPDPTSPPPPTTPVPCDLDCGTNGTLDDMLCFCNCNPGFEGQTCSEVLPTGRTPQPISPDNCTLDCGDHGNRVRGSCSCLCDKGFSGTTCENDDVASCLEGTYCFNGGTCETIPNTDGQSGNAPTPTCFCPYGFTGDLCEIEVRCPDLDCGPNGNLSPDDCSCVCQDKYSGPMCEVLSDNHTIPCSDKYLNYCLNGGTCHQLVGIKKPTCNCPDLYRGSSRCQYINNYDPSKAPPVVHPSIEQNSMKVIITLTVIFISLLLVLLLVVFIYIKNKNYQERHKRAKTGRNPLRPPSYNVPHPLHQNTNNQAGNQSRGIQELEMEPRRPSAPPTVMRMESEGSVHSTPSQRSHSVDVRYSSVPVQANPVVARTMHNGSARKISQASIHSNRSTSSHRSTGSSPGSGKRRRLGYEAVPANEPADTIEEYHGDTAACEDASIIMLPKEDVCSDGESVCSSEPDDVVDVPNPQISAIETHLAQPSEDYDDNVDRDFSADVVNANVHFSNPYAQDDSPSLSPRGHSTSCASPHDVNLHENPFHGGLSLQGKSHQPNNKLYANDAYYGNRYEDEIDRSSPPHAV